MFKALIACEESQAVTIELRKLGVEAYSCDILQCSGSMPQYHLQKDVRGILNQNWDLLIAFPPCTDLAVAGAAWFKKKQSTGQQQRSINFFMELVNAPIKYIAIENPVGIMSKLYRKPHQIIQPYFFGDQAQKSTCLWLKNLPLLYHNAKPNLFDQVVTHTGKGEFFTYVDKKTGKLKRQAMFIAAAKGFGGKAVNQKEYGGQRSKTFPGIAKAMAAQWSRYIIEKESLTLKNK